LKIIFAGTPKFAAIILEGLIEEGLKPSCVLTQPDRGRGRGRKVTVSPVKKVAIDSEIDILQPSSLRDEAIKLKIQIMAPDVLVVAAYGLILPREILCAPKFGCINVHASVLPRWRGAAPIERAVLAGDLTTGISIMQMDEGLDTGPVYESSSSDIIRGESISGLEARLALMGSGLLCKTVRNLPGSKLPQDARYATYAAKLSNEDRKIDWSHSADRLFRQIWALSERLPVTVEINDQKIQILEAVALQTEMEKSDSLMVGSIIDTNKRGITVKCIDGLLCLTKLKVIGGKGTTLNPSSALNGFPHLFKKGAIIKNINESD
jgi:methionyl-tRNA formyltransferase